MRLARRPLLLLALLAGCSEQRPTLPVLPQLAPPALDAVVHSALVAHQDHGLLLPDAEDLLDAADLLELWAATGPGSERALRALLQEEPERLAALLLGVSEELTSPDSLRRAAAVLLADRAPRAALPRLTLRLKYEKDWVASALLARGLLRLGSGAGIEALSAILLEESREEAMYQEARAQAGLALRELPPCEGWEPGADFGSDWERLLEVQAIWNRTRTLPGVELPAPEPDLEAELWRMVEQLRSQALRPVDDARYVLARTPANFSYAVLLAATRESDRYVRDHVLEILSWIGTPMTAWATRTGADVAVSLAELIGDGATRPRAIEALGALGDPRAVPWLMVWLLGSPEECTAAADALLRCAGPEHLPALLSARGCTPEAAFSLALLRQRLDPAQPAAVAGKLDPAEVARRLQWDAERAAMPR